MPSTTLPECARYVPPPPTQLDLEFADLAVIDLAKARTPEGRAELAPQLRDALRTIGFVYAINHGYTQAQRDRVFDIANVPFTCVPEEEKKSYAANIAEAGFYTGYKPRKFYRLDDETNARDESEQYELYHDVYDCAHPQALRPFLPELDAFTRHNHYNILHPFLRLIALSLELPEETLVEKHRFEPRNVTTLSFIKYFRRTDEEEEKAKNIWLKGHTDIGVITILWSQPVGGLQILSPDGKWRWVRHMDNALVINTGDIIDFFTGGYYKPTIHRVVRPPADQRGYDRLGVFYFTVPESDVSLAPLAQSPLLQRVGFERRWSDEEAPNSEVWRKERTISYGRVLLKKGAEKDTEEEIIEGTVVKHYN